MPRVKLADISLGGGHERLCAAVLQWKVRWHLDRTLPPLHSWTWAIIIHHETGASAGVV